MKIKDIRKHEPLWHVIDMKNQVVGRKATLIANLLRGKGKPEFVMNMDCGDHVVVINAAELAFTGNKLADKKYYHHSGHPGGLKTYAAKDLIETNPAKIIEYAVKGMLPKNKLQPVWMQRLHVYAGAEHPHQAHTSKLTAQ